MVTRPLNVAGLSFLRTVLLAAIAVVSSLSFNSEAQADYGEAISALRGTNGLPADFRRAERLLRACAWQDDDILCQISLAELYGYGVFPGMANPYSRPGTDLKEALVWYYIAYVNLALHDVPDGRGQFFDRFRSRIHDGCNRVYQALADDAKASSKERITYIYRSRGASGSYQLGELHSDILKFAADNEWRRKQKRPKRSWLEPDKGIGNPPKHKRDCINLFFVEPDAADRDTLEDAHRVIARTHFLEARQQGHPYAEDKISDPDAALPQENDGVNPGNPYQYSRAQGHLLIYPPFSLSADTNNVDAIGIAKVPARYLTDASDTQLEHQPELNLLGDKSAHDRNYLTNVALQEIYTAGSAATVKGFRADLDIVDKSPALSPWEIVLALKLAANDGGIRSANLLGEMYFNGIGVPREMDKARYAFEIATFKGDTLNVTLKDKDPHAPASLKLVSDRLKNLSDDTCGTDCIDPEDVDKNAVRNLCLILADDTRFPNHRLLAELYLGILKASPEPITWQPKSKNMSISDCKKKLGF